MNSFINYPAIKEALCRIEGWFSEPAGHDDVTIFEFPTATEQAKTTTFEDNHEKHD